MVQNESLALVRLNASDKYPIAPLTNPEEIRDNETRSIVLKLSSNEKDLEGKLIKTPGSFSLQLAEQPSFSDPRSLIKRGRELFMLAILPQSKSARLKDRIDSSLKLAKSRFHYDWMKKAYGVVEESIVKLKNSYQDISNYYITIDGGIKKIKQKIESEEAEIMRCNEQIGEL